MRSRPVVLTIVLASCVAIACGGTSATGPTPAVSDAAADAVGDGSGTSSSSSSSSGEGGTDAQVGDAASNFPCGSNFCDPSSEFCMEFTDGAGAPSYTCQSSSSPFQSTSTGGPGDTCKPTDCPCLIRRVQEHAYTNVACTLDGGAHAYVTCTGF
jgi:hypothetical protein